MPLSQKLILIAEDSQDDADLLRRAFKRAGLTNPYLFFDDGQKLISHLQNNTSELPVLILLDIKMPMMDGLTALKWIRSQRNLENVPVVMLTSSKMDKDLADAKAAGADSYLVKPSSLEELIALVIRLHKHWILVD
jgi:two-component system, response regulator